MKFLLSIALFALSLPALAGEVQVRQAIQGISPNAKVTNIAKTAVPGLMEVQLDGAMGPTVVYTSEDGEHLFVGDLLEVKSRRNLTRERLDKLTEVKWESLPLENAVKVVRGNGARKFAVFSDPDCPYCKKAEQEFMKMEDVTIYTFLYPLQMHPDAPRKSKLVWCSKDRGQAWLDLMLKGKTPAGKTDCDNPVDENLALGAKLRIDGTPAMILANGKRIPGYVPADRLDALLNGIDKNGKNGAK
ncbi:MAG: DsbC family protein [Betaproteobacteria bacterium]|nr:DsbC family protein [Betaproteobacteria bacterium]